MQTAINLPFADGTYRFVLPIARIVEIEAKAGPIDGVKHRLVHGGWSIHDVVEVIRQGLIGGGEGEVDGTRVEVGALKANSLIAGYVDGKSLGQHHLTARVIVAALFTGYEPAMEAQKKSPQPKAKRPRRSTSASSSTTASPSA